jgi:hypothetical protein
MTLYIVIRFTFANFLQRRRYCGHEFLARVNAKLNLENEELTLQKCADMDYATLVSNARGTGEKVNKIALTVFTNSTEPERNQPRQVGKRRGHKISEKGRRQPLQEVNQQEAESWIIKSTETIK